MLKLLVEHDFLLNNFLNEETEVTHQANRMYSFPDGSVVKNLPATARDVGLIIGLGRFSGEGNGNPLQYSCLENPMARGAWWAAVHGVAESDMTERPLYFLLIDLHKHSLKLLGEALCTI